MEEMSLKPVDLSVKGMTCTNCALSIERYLQKEGLSQVMVDFSQEAVHFEIEHPTQLPKIIKGIEQLGFEVPTPTNSHSADEQLPRWSKIEKRFGIALLFTFPLWLHMLLPIPALHNPYVQFALATPVFLLGVYHFGRSAWFSLKSGVANMDVLIAIGIIAAYGYSVYGMLFQLGHDFMFFETAAGIVTLVLMGNVIEHRSVRKTTTAVAALTELQHPKALRIHSESQPLSIEEVEVHELQVGDLVQVNAGDRIPTDGVLVNGSATVDESMVTGESLPIAKKAQDRLIGGTLLLSGNIQLKVTHQAEDSVLAHIIALVKKAQADKPQIQQLADKISAVFVPIVLGIAVLTFLLSYGLFELSLQAAIIHSVAVLVIACPCAMGLATPTAVVVGIGRATRKGILIKGGRTLEEFSQIRQLVFDKTGTLTTGKFVVEAVHAQAEDQVELQRIAYSLSQASSHPLSVALRVHWKGTSPISLEQVVEHKGLGMEGVDAKGNRYQMGSAVWAEGLTEDKDHSLYILKNRQLLGSIDMQDEIRPYARETLSFLKKQGITPIMLSGDRQIRCEEVGKALGIEEIYAQQRPSEKVAILRELSQKAPTGMVGDGINDAPALAQAQVGISLGQATQAAIESAQIVLLKEDIRALKDLYLIGKHSVKTIRQNLFWAFFYNVLAIPLAAVGFLSPLIGAITMALSDVIVIGNSLRLRVKTLR